MSDGLWRDDLRCGCQKGSGHSCRPIWMTETEWGHADRTPNRGGLSGNGGKIITEGSTGAGGAGTPPVIPRPRRPDLLQTDEDDYLSHRAKPRQLEPTDRRHGTDNAYHYWHCKCPPCLAAHTSTCTKPKRVAA